MIDLHAHVLPGLDDGPRNMDEALHLLSTMHEQGVKTVVATAHAFDGRYNATRDAVLQATEQVMLALGGIEMKILPSMELLLGFDLIRAVKSGQVLGLNGTRNLVVEMPAREFPAYTDRALFELMLAGYRPILNHPERNMGIQRRPDLMFELAEKGVGAMITAASLLGRFGSSAKLLAERFLREEVAAFVVSDAHNLQGRAPLLPQGLAAARACGKHDQLAEESLLV